LAVRPIIVTGAASGIGAATAAYLREQQHAVIGVDVRHSDITTDLGTTTGRQRMASQVAVRAPDGIGAIIACARRAAGTPSEIVAVNYFGAVATLELLRPLLAGAPRPRGVLVGSSAALLGIDQDLVDACLNGDEARALAHTTDLAIAYSSSKNAAIRWMRAAAIRSEWGGSGISLNAVSPGIVKTAITAPYLATREGRAMLETTTPTIRSDYGDPSDLAEVLTFLATMQTNYLLGQTIYVDGGTDVLLRPNRV